MLHHSIVPQGKAEWRSRERGRKETEFRSQCAGRTGGRTVERELFSDKSAKVAAVGGDGGRRR